MAACSSRVLDDVCVCYDLRYKLMYLNLDRLLSRLPEFEVEKLNYKFIGLTLEVLEKFEDSEYEEESGHPEGATTQPPQQRPPTREMHQQQPQPPPAQTAPQQTQAAARPVNAKPGKTPKTSPAEPPPAAPPANPENPDTNPPQG